MNVLLAKTENRPTLQIRQGGHAGKGKVEYENGGLYETSLLCPGDTSSGRACGSHGGRGEERAESGVDTMRDS